MKIVIPGGSGQVGTILARHFHSQGHEVVVISRNAPTSACVKPATWRVVGWNGQTLGAWAAELEGADVLINLAGRIVNCRYNHRNRCEIWASRTLKIHADRGSAVASESGLVFDKGRFQAPPCGSNGSDRSAYAATNDNEIVNFMMEIEFHMHRD